MKAKYLRMMRKTELGPYPQADFLTRQRRGVARKHSLLILVVAFALAAIAGVGDGRAEPGVSVPAAQAAPGSYELSFLTSSGVPVTSTCRAGIGSQSARRE
jgi:hypothetical protein